MKSETIDKQIKQKRKAKTENFPKMAIETAVRESLEGAIALKETLHGSATSDTNGDSPIGPQPAVDSLVVVEILLVIEDLVPFDVPESLVQPGGYETVDEAVSDLVPKLEEIWRKTCRG